MIYQVMEIEKSDEVSWGSCEEVGQQFKNLDSDSRRLEHLIEFFNDATDVFEFVIALLSLHVSIDKMYQVMFG